MWPWIKRWRDWAMHNLWPLPRIGPQPQALHYSFEKAGLTLHDQPIPWNAEIVRVEALVQLHASGSRRKADFFLHLDGQSPIPADSLRHADGDNFSRLIFRFPPPAQSTHAELFWNNRRLGQITLPVLSREDFLLGLRLQLPTLFVRLGDQNVACQTFVSTQCRGLLASAVLTSPTSLVPLLDLGLQVEFRSERGNASQTVAAQLCSSQLSDRQALVSVIPHRFPRRIGTWIATWMIADRPLATQRVRAISQHAFQRSLRVQETRFVIQNAKQHVTLSPQLPPLETLERVGPCFLVSSREPGMAGICPLQVRVQVSGAIQAPMLEQQDILITDGPTMVAPGTLDAHDLEQVTAFELLLKNTTLGLMPLSPVPAAAFNSEGGFKPASEFTWTTSAEEELNERLSRLLEGKNKGS